MGGHKLTTVRINNFRVSIDEREALETLISVRLKIGRRQQQNLRIVRKELDGYQQQLADLEQTEASVAPQMQRMLDVLQEFVAADIPFLPHERNERVENLQELMQRADIGLSEKYRRLLEAYQIESDYGYTLEAWRDSLQRDDKMLSVDFLRIGRVMLYYQTPDGHETGWWNPQARQWQVLEGSARRPVTQAIAVARQQKSADWLELPVKTLALEAKQ